MTRVLTANTIDTNSCARAHTHSAVPPVDASASASASEVEMKTTTALIPAKSTSTVSLGSTISEGEVCHSLQVLALD